MPVDPKFGVPETRATDHSDTLHGVVVADPYRWLEQDVRESEEVGAWVEAQNAATQAFLESIPERDAIAARLRELWDYERVGLPQRVEGRFYSFRNDGLQDQPVLIVQDEVGGDFELVLDPNTWSEDGTLALAGTSFSDDGRHLAYGVAEAGSDWVTWRVLDLRTRQPLGDEISWVKYSRAVWTPDGKGFFYGRYAAPKEGEEYQSLNFGQQIYYHRIGGAQRDDVLVYHRPDRPEWGFFPSVTDDGRFLILTVWKGTDSKHRVLIKDLREPYGMPVDLIEDFDNDYTFIGNDGWRMFFRTDLDAPRGRVIAIDLRHPERERWVELIPESDSVLRSVSLVGNQFITNSLRDAHSEVRIYALDGRHVRDIKLPGIGTAEGFDGRRGDTATFFRFSSFATPPSIYKVDLVTGDVDLVSRADAHIEPTNYLVEQVFVTSKDGTRVPMFLARHKDTRPTGETPTLLYGYGGFDHALTPDYRVSRRMWMDMGGLLAIANLRGGGEYGEAWHRAGTKERKQNVFDDAIACAEQLVSQGWTCPARLAVQGGSNGGLLVGALMTQRPELFGACLPAVGVMDMLRFHRFTAGRFWVDDYGSADDPAGFEVLRAYSPYHNLREGERYPATLVTTADTDDRVIPGHSFKFTAQLQRCQGGDAPTLIRVETRAGHGAGTPTSKVIAEVADLWAFLVKTLDFEPRGL